MSCSVCNYIFNHTSLYQPHYGKLILHLTLAFETKPKSNQPGEYLRYYRLRNNLTTRQLAEQVGIVPATLLKYEQGITPIPYDTAARLSEWLKIDVSLICYVHCIALSRGPEGNQRRIKTESAWVCRACWLESKLLLSDEKRKSQTFQKSLSVNMDALNAKQSTNFT